MASDIADAPTSGDSTAYRCGALRSDTVKSAHEFMADAKSPDFYQRLRREPLYRFVTKPNYEPHAHKLWEEWAKASQSVYEKIAVSSLYGQGSTATKEAYGFLRFTATAEDKSGSLGAKEWGREMTVLIALEKLGKHNGLYVTLEQGESICVDSRKAMRLPKTGGGMAFIVTLSVEPPRKSPAGEQGGEVHSNVPEGASLLRSTTEESRTRE